MTAPMTTSEVSLRRRFDLADLAPLITLALLLVVFSVLAENFLSLRTLTIMLQQGAVLAIVATGLTFVLLAAEIDLSVGMVALLAACLCGVLWEQPWAAGPQSLAQGPPPAVSPGVLLTVLVAPLVLALFLGWLTGWLTVTSGLPSFIISLAMMNIALGLSRFLTGSRKFSVPPLLQELGNGAWQTPGGIRFPKSALVAAVVMLIAHLVLQHLRFGRFVYMTGGNREAARLSGVRTHRIITACLAISAATAGLGGMLNAGRLNSVSLDQNADLLLNAVACVVLGGTSLFGGEGGIGRTLIGVATFMVLQVGLNLINVVRLVKSWPLTAGWKEWILQSSVVTQFDMLRPFLLGVALLLALVIQGRLLARRRG